MDEQVIEYRLYSYESEVKKSHFIGIFCEIKIITVIIESGRLNPPRHICSEISC